MTDLPNPQEPSDALPLEPTPPSPVQPPEKEVVPLRISTLQKYKKLIFIIAVTLVALVLVGTIYHLATARTVDPEPTSTPTPTSSPVNNSKTNRNLRLGNLSLLYPDDWLILFSPILDQKTPNLTPIYFTRSLSEYREQALCAGTGSCTEAPLQLTFSPRTVIWTGYSLGDYVRTTDPDYPLDSLKEIQIGAYTGLAGYTDYPELTYQALIPTSDKSFQQITVRATEDSREMLSQFVDSLKETIVIDSSSSIQPSQLGEKHVFTLKLSARLATTDYNILELIISNLLAPSDSSSSAAYILYTTDSISPSNYLDYTYTLLTNNKDLKPGDYSSSQITATLSEAPGSDFAPYLEDPKYCKENTDCVYRSDFCTVDAYNRYHLFHPPWGCGSTNYEGLGDSETLSESLDCNDGLTVDFDSLECVENKCVVNNPTPICKEEE